MSKVVIGDRKLDYSKLGIIAFVIQLSHEFLPSSIIRSRSETYFEVGCLFFLKWANCSNVFNANGQTFENQIVDKQKDAFN